MKDSLFLLSLASLLVLSAIYPAKVSHFPNYINWETVVSLIGLMAATVGIKESGFFSRIPFGKVKSERHLAVLLVLTTFFLSMFLTNDVTLLVIIPATLSTGAFEGKSLLKIVTIETIAANIGSMTTPIGNPQNIYLWHKWGVTFQRFTESMLSVSLLSLIPIIFISALAFRNKPVATSGKENGFNLELLCLSTAILIFLVVFINMDIFIVPVSATVLIYAISYRNVLRKIDWMLIVIIAIMFIDLQLISDMGPVKAVFCKTNMHNPKTVFLAGVAVSQIISNVPAAILLTKFSSNYKAIAYGVNIGGNGLFIGSLANIIAFRITKEKGLWWEFHKYSIPFLAVTAFIPIFIQAID